MSGQAQLTIRRPRLTEDGKHLLYIDDVQQWDVVTSAYVEDGDEIVLSNPGGLDNSRLIEHPEEHEDPADNLFILHDTWDEEDDAIAKRARGGDPKADDVSDEQRVWRAANEARG